MGMGSLWWMDIKRSILQERINMGTLRQIENQTIKCPWCGGRTSKNGYSYKHKKEKRKCMGGCLRQFTVGVHYIE